MKLLVCGPMHAAGYAVLASRPDIDVVTLDPPEDRRLGAELVDADGLLLRVQKLTSAMIAAAPHLRIVSRHGVGCDNLPLDVLTARGIPVAITGLANSQSVAEHALYLLLACAKQGRSFDQSVRAGRFGAGLPLPEELYGRTLLIVGFGRSGRLLLPMVRAFGMRVLVATRTPADAEIRALGGEPSDLESALAAADALSLHLPGLPGGAPLLDAARLARLKDGAIIINVSRGSLIDPVALSAELQTGRLRAGLDVFTSEPIAADSPLVQTPNSIFSPHIAGVTEAASIRMAESSAHNAIAGLDGTITPQTLVNPQVLA